MQLSPSVLKFPRSTLSFYLGNDGFDCYHCPFSGESEAQSYDIMVQLCLMQLMGVPLSFKIGREGGMPRTYFCNVSAGGLNYISYFQFTYAQDRIIRKQLGMDGR